MAFPTWVVEKVLNYHRSLVWANAPAKNLLNKMQTQMQSYKEKKKMSSSSLCKKREREKRNKEFKTGPVFQKTKPIMLR